MRKFLGQDLDVWWKSQPNWARGLFVVVVGFILAILATIIGVLFQRKVQFDDNAATATALSVQTTQAVVQSTRAIASNPTATLGKGTAVANTSCSGQIALTGGNDSYLIKSDAGSVAQRIATDYSMPRWWLDHQHLIVQASGLLFQLDWQNPSQVLPFNLMAIPQNTQLVDWSRGSGLALFLKVTDNQYEFYVTDVNGKQIAKTTEGVFLKEIGSVRLAPNGQSVIFSGMMPDQNDLDIYRLDFANGRPLDISGNSASDRNPVWSPDGKYIYFDSNTSGKDHIFRVESGGVPDQLTKGTQGESHPIVSPDGTNLVYVSKENGNSDLITFDLQKRAIMLQLTNALVDEIPSDWC